jgi:hypothetical protein
MGLKTHLQKFILLLIAVLFTEMVCFAQADTIRTHADTLKVLRIQYLADSTRMAREKFVQDSINTQFVRMPDPNRHNQFIDTLLKNNGLDGYMFKNAMPKHHLGVGTARHGRDKWIIVAIFALLIYTGILNRVIGKDIYSVIQAFYDKRAFAKISKEDNLLTSWAFIGLFSLFGFTIGLYFYQVAAYFDIHYAISGFQLFITLSVIVIVLFIVKIMVLRVLAFIFDIQKMVRQYVSILYLTYFNVAFVFLPIVISFSLL